MAILLFFFQTKTDFVTHSVSQKLSLLQLDIKLQNYKICFCLGRNLTTSHSFFLSPCGYRILAWGHADRTFKLQQKILLKYLLKIKYIFTLPSHVSSMLNKTFVPIHFTVKYTILGLHLNLQRFRLNTADSE